MVGKWSGGGARIHLPRHQLAGLGQLEDEAVRLCLGDLLDLEVRLEDPVPLAVLLHLDHVPGAPVGHDDSGAGDGNAIMVA